MGKDDDEDKAKGEQDEEEDDDDKPLSQKVSVCSRQKLQQT